MTANLSNYLNVLIFVLSFKALLLNSKKYESCLSKKHKETRRLFVATCDTRSGWKEFVSLKTWNITGYSLRNQGVTMMNVCSGKNDAS